MQYLCMHKLLVKYVYNDYTEEEIDIVQNAVQVDIEQLKNLFSCSTNKKHKKDILYSEKTILVEV